MLDNPVVTSRVPSYQVFHQVQGSAQVLLLMDNVTAITYINKMGGIHSPLLSQLAKGPMESVPVPQCVNKDSVSPGSTKRPCGSRIQSVPRFQRLEAEQNDFRPNVSKVGAL